LRRYKWALRWRTFILNLATLDLLVLELFAMYTTDRRTDRETDRWTKATLIAPFPTVGGIIIKMDSVIKDVIFVILFKSLQLYVEVAVGICCRTYLLTSVFQTFRVMCIFEKASARGKNTSAFCVVLVFTAQQRAARRYECSISQFYYEVISA